MEYLDGEQTPSVLREQTRDRLFSEVYDTKHEIKIRVKSISVCCFVFCPHPDLGSLRVHPTLRIRRPKSPYPPLYDPGVQGLHPCKGE